MEPLAPEPVEQEEQPVKEGPTPPAGGGSARAVWARPLTGYPRDPDGLAAGAVPAGRGGPDVDDVSLLHGQPQFCRRAVRAQHLRLVLAASPVENL